MDHLQAYAITVGYYEMPISLSSNINRLGPMSAVVRPAMEKMAESLSRLQYLSNVATKNLYDSFANSDATKLSGVRGTMSSLMEEPTKTVISTIKTLFQQASTIQRSMRNADTSIGQTLKVAIEDGTKCLVDMGASVYSSMIMRTGTVQLTLQKVGTTIFCDKL